MSPVTTLRTRTEVADAVLVAKIASGELSSLGVLFDRYAADVKRFVARLGVAAGEVDDVVQGTFLLVIDAAAGCRADGTARAWLFGLAANLVRRRRRSLARLAARVAAWTHQGHFDAPPPTPEAASDMSEQAQRAARALGQLAPKKREAFVMVVMEGLSAEEAAASLGVPIGTVWTRLHHARRELRQRLGEEGSAV